MDQKSNKELAIETALEYTKSWNAADRTAAINPDGFVEVLNKIHSAICSLDEN